MSGAESDRKGVQPEQVDIGELSRLLAYHLPRELSDLFGLDVRPNWPRGAAKQLEAWLRRVWPAIQNVLKNTVVRSPRDATVMTGDLFAAIVPPRMRAPKGKHPIDWLLREHGKVFRDMEAHPVGRKYMRAVNRVIDKYVENDRREAADKFLASLGQREARVVVQPLLRRIRERGMASSMRELESKRPGMEHVSQLLHLYAALAGIYEKLICRLLGLVAIQEGNAPDYEALRRQPLGRNTARLAKYPGMGVFVKGFNRPLRNAIAHGDVEFVITLRRLRFRDRENAYSFSPGQLYKQVVETTALVLSLLLMDSLRTHRRLTAFSDMLRTPNREERRPHRGR